MNNRTQKSAKNMTVGMLSQLFTLLLSFVSRTIFIRYLTTEYLGISGLFSNVLTVLSFAELGIGDAMMYAMYKPVKEENRKQTILIFFRSRHKPYNESTPLLSLCKYQEKEALRQESGQERLD